MRKCTICEKRNGSFETINANDFSESGVKISTERKCSTDNRNERKEHKPVFTAAK